jgi:hypothetical protein
MYRFFFQSVYINYHSIGTGSSHTWFVKESKLTNLCAFAWYTGKHLLHNKKSDDTKGVIRISKSKKDRQHNGQKKKDKWTNNDLQIICMPQSHGHDKIHFQFCIYAPMWKILIICFSFQGQQVVEEILDSQRPGCPIEYFNR